MREKKRIAYQGIAGAYSEEACLHFDPQCEPVGYETFEKAFEAALTHECDYACLAVENSMAGSINATYELLRESALHVVGEEIVQVHHCLMVRPGGTLEGVRKVHSHYQALAQCERFLRHYGFEAITEFDTAGSARMIAERDEEGVAAIASARAAEIYGLEIVKRGMEDVPWNYTRFFILGSGEAPVLEGHKHKSSLILGIRHQPGDLVRCLELFPKYGINMTKLESRPRRDKPWSYIFYIDIEGHIEEEAVASALTGLMRRAAFVKFLGSYPMATTLLPRPTP